MIPPETAVLVSENIEGADVMVQSDCAHRVDLSQQTHHVGLCQPVLRRHNAVDLVTQLASPPCGRQTPLRQLRRS